MQPDIEGFRFLGEYLKNSSPGDEEVVDEAGHHWRVRQQPGAGVRMTMERVDGSETSMTIYEPGPERAAGYPPDLPFMPGAIAMVSGVPSTPTARMVVWTEMPDAWAFAGELEALGTAEGWEVTRSLTAFAGFPIAMSEARRGPERRLVSVTAVGAEHAVMLMQSREEGAS